MIWPKVDAGLSPQFVGRMSTDDDHSSLMRWPKDNDRLLLHRAAVQPKKRATTGVPEVINQNRARNGNRYNSHANPPNANT